MISYSQNFEDVVLDRVFRDTDRGFYVDVGANDLSVLVTNTGGTTFAGPVRDFGGFSAFTKDGSGTLSLTAANPYAGLVDLRAGTLRLAGAGTLAAAGGVDVNGGLLVLDNTAVNLTDRLGEADGSGAPTMLTLGGGELRLLGSAAAASCTHQAPSS